MQKLFYQHDSCNNIFYADNPIMAQHLGYSLRTNNFNQIKNNIMKKVLLTIAILTGSVVIMQSCNNNNPNSTGVNGTADTTKDASISTDVKMSPDTSAMQSANTNNGGTAGTDNAFVTKAAGVGMMEVELGKAAQTNAASQDVKDFGKMLENDHTKANAELSSIAAADNINMPATLPAEHAGHVNALKAKTGADFDKAYIDMMVEGHTQTIADFKKAAKENSDEKVKAFAVKTLPTLETHLAKAKAIKAKMK
jgi:putative membrane protein